MIVTDMTLVEKTDSDTLASTTTALAVPGTTVLDGKVLITVTDAGAICGCEDGLWCSENEFEFFDPTAHTKTVEWLCEHPVQSIHHKWNAALDEQAEYDNLPMIGRRVYDQLRTQIGMGHAQAWLISRREFGLRAAA